MPSHPPTPAHPLGLNFDVTSLGKLLWLMSPNPGLDHMGAFSLSSFFTQ